MGAGAAAIGSEALGTAGEAYAAREQAKAAEAASKYGADIQEKIAARELAAQQQLTGLQLESQNILADAYRQAYQRAQQQYGTGETGLPELYAEAPEELEILREQALTGQAEELQQGVGQLQSALAQQGVRGGQAATQLRRGIGEMTEAASENIQNLIAREALQRAGEERQYRTAQQQALQQFMLTPESAQYSQLQTPEQEAYLRGLLEEYQAVGKPTKPVSKTNTKSVPFWGRKRR